MVMAKVERGDWGMIDDDTIKLFPFLRSCSHVSRSVSVSIRVRGVHGGSEGVRR